MKLGITSVIRSAMSLRQCVCVWGVCFLTTFLTHVSAQSKPERENRGDSLKYTIEYCVNTFSLDNAQRTAVGYQYWFADKDFADGKTLKLSVVSPHSATHPPHAHEEDEFFFLLEGTAECYLHGQRKVVGPYTSFYCPSGVEHGIRNIGDSELKYLVIKEYEKNH
jgi:mannose-6-phosphate isomerase-like protein (cupin superfamily)